MIDKLFESMRNEGYLSAMKKGYDGEIRDAYAEGYAEGAVNELTVIIRRRLERGETAESIADDIGMGTEDVMRVITGRYEQPDDWFE